MEKLKAFIKKNGKNILYILALIGLAVGLVLVELPNLNIDIRVNQTTKTTNKY